MGGRILPAMGFLVVGSAPVIFRRQVGDDTSWRDSVDSLSAHTCPATLSVSGERSKSP